MLNFIREKWLNILLSIFLGWMLWMYANWVESSKDRLDATFEVRHPSSDLQITVEPDIKRVTMTFQGPTGAIYEATRSDRNVRVVYTPEHPETLADGKPREVALDRSMVFNLPPNVEILQFIPPSIEVTIDRISRKLVPIAPPEIVGTPEPGYEIYKVEIVRPKEVMISGPASLLDKLSEVKTEPVDVTGRSDDFRDSEHRLIRKYAIEGVTGQITTPGLVELFVGIRRQAAHKTLSGVQIEIAQPECRPPDKPLDLVVADNPIDLKLEGPADALNQLKPESVRALVYADVAKLKQKPDEPDKQTVMVSGLPDGVKLVEPVVVNVRIRPNVAPHPPAEAPKL